MTEANWAELWIALAAAGVAGVLTIAGNWIRDAVAASARVRRLQELELCVNIGKSVIPDSPTAKALDGETADITAAIARARAGRSLRRSFFSWLLGLVILAVPLGAAYWLMFPAVRPQPWVIVPIVGVTAAIYTMERKPRFIWEPAAKAWAAVKRPVPRGSV